MNSLKQKTFKDLEYQIFLIINPNEYNKKKQIILLHSLKKSKNKNKCGKAAELSDSDFFASFSKGFGYSIDRSLRLRFKVSI